MVRNYKLTGLKKYRKTDPADLKQAVDDVNDKHSGRQLKNTAFIILLSMLADRLKVCSDWGCPLNSWALRLLVKEYLDKQQRKIPKFKDNLPDKDFVYSFVKCHNKDLSFRMYQNIKRNRAAVSQDDSLVSVLKETRYGQAPTREKKEEDCSATRTECNWTSQ